MKVLTASRLCNGEVVWLAADHSWTGSIDRAEVARDERTQEKLERAARAALLKNEVVDVSVVDVTVVNGAVRALRLRERIGITGLSQRHGLAKPSHRRQASAA